VSDAVAESCVEDGHRLLVDVRAWPQAHRADLVQSPIDRPRRLTRLLILKPGRPPPCCCIPFQG
jgi:hypothetical protein